MKIWTDASLKEGCIVFENEPPQFVKWLTKPTVNEAEYRALIYALKQAEIRTPINIQVFSDSELIVNQIVGIYRCKNKRLKVYRDIARLYFDDHYSFPISSLTWIPREQNLAGLVLEKR